MTRLKALYLLLSFVSATIATAQDTVTIHGKVTGDTKGYNNIYYHSKEIPKDSAVIQNGKFTIRLPFNGRMAPVLFSQYGISYAKSYRPLPILIDQPGTIEIEMAIEKGMYEAKITGMETTELFYSFLTQQDKTYRQLDEELKKLYGKSWIQNNDPLAAKMKISRDSLNSLMIGKMTTDFVVGNKDLKIGVYILANYGRSCLSMEDLENTFAMIPENMKKTADGEKLAAYLRGIKGTKIGSSPKNFVLNDENGKPFSLDQYKGKYIWIDFWASWCGPCKNAFPRMRELYAEYKDRNLEIIGVSADAKIEPWLKSLETIKNPWKQLWDNKNVTSEFAVTAYPTSFLIGPDGKILVKEVGFNPNRKGEIVLKLEELLGPSKSIFAKPEEEKKVTIHGKVSGDTKGFNSVYCYFPGSSKDSAVIKNGEFKFELPYTGTSTPAFYTQYEISGKRAYRPFPMLIDQPGTIEIEMDIEKGFRAAKITGIKTTELYNSFLIQQDAVYKQISEELGKLYGKTWAQNNDPIAPKLMASRDSLSKLHMGKLVADFVLSNKDAKIGIFILNGSGKGVFSTEELEKTFNQLPENMKKTEEGVKLAAYLRGIKSTKVGSTPKNFVLNDENGKPFSLDQYNGKYIWIDFWASWCGPCKMAFPLMREIYAAYKDKNLEIIGISTDTKIEPWLKSLETIKNPWKQVWDNKNVMSEFAVTAFPTSFLIGPDGKILVKEIGYNPDEKGEIFKKLEELLGPSNITFPKPKETKPQGAVMPATMTKSVPGVRIQ